MTRQENESTAPEYDRENHPAHTLPAYGCDTTVCGGWLTAMTADSVPEEVLDAAESYADVERTDRDQIDWESIFDRRLEGMTLTDGRTFSLGDEYDTPAQRKIKRETRKRLAE